MTETGTQDRVIALRKQVEGAVTSTSALITGQIDNRDWFVSLYCPSLTERGGQFQTWYGRGLEQAVERAEQDINRWCDKAAAEKDEGDAGA